METLAQPHAPMAHTGKKEKITALEKFFAELETSRLGFSPLILLIIACLGGIAAAFAVQKSETALMAVAVTTMFVETLIIAVAPMRLVFWFAVAALIVDLFVFIS